MLHKMLQQEIQVINKIYYMWH